MKKKSFLLSVITLILSLTSCGNLSNNNESNELPSEEENPIVQPEIGNEETDVIPVSKYVEGSSEENIGSSDAYNSDGGLIVPFDTAFPEYMNKAVYDEASLLMKANTKDVSSIFKQIKSYGIKSYEFVTLVKEDVAWYKLNLSGTKSYEIINHLRAADSKALMFDLNYILEEESLQFQNGNSRSAESYFTEIEGIVPGSQGNKFFKEQYYFKNLNLKEAYKFLKEKGAPEGGKGITVAVIDTGVDLDHEDLKDNIWVNAGETANNGIDDDGNGYVDDVKGWNFVDENNTPYDDHGHGTHVAGIIAAQNNKVGTLGIAYNSKVMALKAGDQSGSFTQSRIAQAIYYAYMNGADVINMSFGGDTCSIAVQDALIAAYTTCSLVAAAGNEGLPTEGIAARPIYPAAFNFVIGVMSISAPGALSAFSNYDPMAFTTWEYETGSWGENVYSTIPNNKYMALSGTSMATPMVSAVIALLKSYYSNEDMYPSKFFMAQVAASSEVIVHPIRAPGACVLDAYTALTKLPKPNVKFLNHYLFDRKEHSNDNNENGSLDAGETVYFAPVFINRWGKATDFNVTLDTRSPISQTESPYVTIENTSFNFGDIGTYSTKDYLILGEDHSTYIGADLSKSLKINVLNDIPNAVNVNININITYRNALDEEDTTLYTSTSTVKLYISNGTVLPNVIDTDMTLTNDKLWIIEGKTFIEEGSTLRIEPGTTVQFGSTETDRIYSSSYSSPGLFIYGSLIAEGESDNPINFLTSEEAYNDSFIISTGLYQEKYDIYIKLRYLNIEGGLGFINLTEGEIDIEHCNFELLIKERTILSNNESRALSHSFALKNAQNSKFRFNFIGSNIHKLHLELELTNVSNSLIKLEKNVNVSSSASIALFKTNNITISNRDIQINIDFYHYNFISSSLTTDYQCYSRNYGIHHIANIYEPTIVSYNAFQTQINMEIEELCYLNLPKKLRDLFLDFERNDIFIPTFKNFSTGLELGKFYVGHNNLTILYIDGKYYDISGEELEIDDIKNILEKNDTADLGIAQKFEKYNNLFSSSNDKVFALNVQGDSTAFATIYTTTTLFIINAVFDIEYMNLCEENFPIIRDLIYKHFDSHIQENQNINLLTNDFNNVIINAPSKVSKNENNEGMLNLNTKDPYVSDEIVVDGYDDPSRSKIGLIDETHNDNEKLWPYITKMELTNKDGERQSTFGNEQINVKLTFNRDMDMDAPIRVRFGSYSIAADYEIDGTFIDPRTWIGTYTLNTLIESGTQYFNISGGHAAGDSWLTLEEPIGRFKFVLDTSKALSQTISGIGTDEGILLNWFQDDYDLSTVMGYNIYRSTEKDGNYQKINTQVIPFDETSFLDKDVMPGMTYWYTFTMVLTDFSETSPAGKITATAKDTMAPNIYHTPVYQTYTENNLIINCTISDNIGIQSATLYYRTTGSTEYKAVNMTKLNDRYSAKINANEITTAGIEYYIEASDGVNTITKGSAADPYQVIVKDSALIRNIGDVDGNGEINVKDAHMLLAAIYGEILLTDDQFIRADLNADGVLSTAEALRILQYINGTITSLTF